MTPKPAKNPIVRLKTACNRDRLKSALFGGLFALAIALWARNLYIGPPAVSAAALQPVQVVAPSTPPGAAKSPADAALMRWLDKPAPPVSKNLFAIDPDAFSH